MRVLPVRALSALVVLLIASTASAVTIDWVPVDNPGNACDPLPRQPCVGGVGYGYLISKYEVTNAQYAEFLNAVAASDPYNVYNSNMSITRSGAAGSFTYAPVVSRENQPVNYVSYYNAVQFSNWLSNGQPIGPAGPGTTFTGSYTIGGPTPLRNPGATIVLPSVNEWYKAAYYDPTTLSYFDYPTSSNAQLNCVAPTSAPNSANCGNAVGSVTAVGAYLGSASPYGTFDMAGNVREWMDTCQKPPNDDLCAAAMSWFGEGAELADAHSASPLIYGYFNISNALGFRVAMVPEPSTGLLMAAGLIGLAVRRRVRA